MLHMDEEDLVTTIDHCIRACSCRRALWQGKTLKLFCLLCLFLPLYPSWSNMKNKRWVWWQDHPTIPKKLLPIESFCRYPLDLTCANALWMNIFQKYFPKRFVECCWNTCGGLFQGMSAGQSGPNLSLSSLGEQLGLGHQAGHQRQTTGTGSYGKIEPGVPWMHPLNSCSDLVQVVDRSSRNLHHLQTSHHSANSASSTSPNSEVRISNWPPELVIFRSIVSFSFNFRNSKLA